MEANHIPTQKALHVISLGVGVQSSTMTLMAAHGEITPMPNYSIFSDTQGEPKSVYKWLNFLCGSPVIEVEPGIFGTVPGEYRTWLPFPVKVVTKGNLAETALKIRISKAGNSYTNSNVPAFLKVEGQERAGLQMRQCTKDFKIDIILREVRRLVGKEAMSSWRKKHRIALRSISQHDKAMRAAGVPVRGRAEEWEECWDDALVVQWIGISNDEWLRAKPSRLPYIVHIWPLIERKMTRRDCLSWMKKHGYPEPPRSACVYCPYHGDSEWLLLKETEPEEFERAAKFEDDYQVALSKIQRRTAVPFLHRSLTPLREIDFAGIIKTKADIDSQQPDFFGSECEGMCGV